MQAKKEMLAIKSLNERLGEDTDGIVFVIGRGNGSCEIGNGAYTNVGTLPERI